MVSINAHPHAHSPNRAIFFAVVCSQLAVLFALAYLQAGRGVWVAVLLATLWLTVVHWALIHEAIHKLLFVSPRANEIGGRMLAILMGTSFHALRFGHLMHHQYNRQFHSEHAIAPTWGGRLYYYANLLFGFYASEVMVGWLLLVLPQRYFIALARATFLHDTPDIVHAGERFFYARGHIGATRLDAAVSLLLYAAAFSLAGAQWPWLLGFITVRALVISFMDNIYHFGTPVDNSKVAKELHLSPAMAKFILYGNYHETHHRNPGVPWRQLPQMHAQQQRRFDGDFITHGWQQFYFRAAGARA